MENQNTLEFYEARLRNALDLTVLESWRRITLWLGVLFAGVAVSHGFGDVAWIRPIMIGLASITSGIFLVLFLVLQRRAVPNSWAHPIGFGMALLILFNTLYHLYLSNEVLLTTNLILTLIGVGFLFLSLRWFLLVPIVTLLGWLWVERQAPHVFSWGYFGLSLVMATVLSALIQETRVRSMRRLEGLRIQDEHRKAALETTVAVSQRITSILDLDVLLNQVAELIKERYGYYYVGIFLLDAQGTAVISRAGTGEMGRELCARGFQLQVGKEGLIGWAVAHRITVCANDVLKDPRHQAVDIVPLTRSELVVPLQVGPVLLGALDIHSDKPDAFRTDDIALFKSLADQVAIAIQNALLYQREQARRRLAETLYQVGQALSQTLDLQEVLDRILEQLAMIVPFERGSVMLRNGEELEFAATRGFPDAARPSQIRVSIKADDVYEQVCRTHKPLAIAEVLERADWHHVPGLPPARSWLGVPLIRLGQVIGMFSLTRETPNPYTGDEAELAVTFAGQAAVVLENARLYANVTRAYEQLGRLDRTKSDFINIASHELRTPLTLMRGYSQILMKDRLIAANPTLHQMVEGIASGTGRLHEIIDSMLDVVKIDSGAFELRQESVSIYRLVEIVAREFHPDLAERNLNLDISGLQDLPGLEADPAALRKVFYNLIINAIKYTPDGGRITLSGRELPRSRTALPQGGVEIQVQDTGIGIDPQFHDLIFTKFYQTGEVALHSSGKTKFKGGGPGLGLAIAKGIVEAHGGRVWVESPGYDEEACPGSTFYVLLPLRKG